MIDLLVVILLLESLFICDQGKDWADLLHFMSIIIKIKFFGSLAALANVCHQVYPSGYAHHFSLAPNFGTNCMRYRSNLQPNVYTDQYIHCHGTQFKVTGWSNETNQLLFTFQSKVYLTTITLHYYSDSVRGRPKLRFYAVHSYYLEKGAQAYFHSLINEVWSYTTN